MCVTDGKSFERDGICGGSMRLEKMEEKNVNNSVFQKSTNECVERKVRLMSTKE